MNLTAKSVWMLLLVFLVLPAHAAPPQDGNEGGHGGDEVALEFLDAFDRARIYVQRDPSLAFASLRGFDFESTLASPRILTVDEPLFVEWGNQRQESAAVNYPRSKIIKVNRSRWRAIASPALKAALALHEVLGLVGLEETGNYPYSGLYLARVGGAQNPDPDLIWPKLPDGAQLPTNLAKVYKYSCRQTFIEGEGVGYGHVSCVPSQRLGFLYASYPYYFSRARFESSVPPASEAYFRGSICEMAPPPRYSCDRHPYLDFGLAKSPEGSFVVALTAVAGPEEGNAVLGYAAAPNEGGKCSEGLVKVSALVARPSSIHGLPDGSVLPSNFVNERGGLNSFRFGVEGELIPALTVLRAKNTLACEASHSYPPPHPAPGSCVDARVDETLTLAQYSRYERDAPEVCVVPREAIRQ